MNTQTKLPEPKEPRVKPVSGFMTTDGKLFDHRPQAEAHQNKIDFFDWCKKNLPNLTNEEIADSVWVNFNVTPRDGD